MLLLDEFSSISPTTSDIGAGSVTHVDGDKEEVDEFDATLDESMLSFEDEVVVDFETFFVTFALLNSATIVLSPIRLRYNVRCVSNAANVDI